MNLKKRVERDWWFMDARTHTHTHERTRFSRERMGLCRAGSRAMLQLQLLNQTPECPGGLQLKSWCHNADLS